MKDKDSVSLEALNGLLSERKRYEEWLAALEARRAGTGEAVYERVKGDYETRLRDVSGRLAARSEEVRSSIDSLTAKLKEVSRTETVQHEVRQEAELRAAVGEYSEGEWEKLKQESEKELARIAKDRGALETKLVELNRVLDATAGVSPAGRADPEPPSVAPPSPPPESEAAAPAETAEMGLGSQAPSASGQLSARSFSTGWPQRDDGEEPASAQPETADSGAGAKKSSAGAAAATSTQTATAAKPRRGGLPDLRTEQQKTLKCPECGAANYPTEWYCERCGGELATL